MLFRLFDSVVSLFGVTITVVGVLDSTLTAAFKHVIEFFEAFVVKSDRRWLRSDFTAIVAAVNA